MKRAAHRKDGIKPPADARRKSDSDILKAALELGMELGFDGLMWRASPRGLVSASRRSIGRWPDAWSIVADAVFADVARSPQSRSAQPPARVFGRPCASVRALVRGHYGKILRPLIGRAQVDKRLRQALAKHWLSARREISRKIVRRGVASGELRRLSRPGHRA